MDFVNIFKKRSDLKNSNYYIIYFKITIFIV